MNHDLALEGHLHLPLLQSDRHCGPLIAQTLGDLLDVEERVVLAVPPVHRHRLKQVLALLLIPHLYGQSHQLLGVDAGWVVDQEGEAVSVLPRREGLLGRAEGRRGCPGGVPAGSDGRGVLALVEVRDLEVSFFVKLFLEGLREDSGVSLGQISQLLLGGHQDYLS